MLNAHFQTVFGITKTQSTLLQLAYFGAYLVFAPFASIFVCSTPLIASELSSDRGSSPQMRKKGYKAGIHLGLTLYSLGERVFRSAESTPFVMSVARQARSSSGPQRSTRSMAALWAARSSSVSVQLSRLVWPLVLIDCNAGCGLACLEVAANSYISVLGTPKYASVRLNFSQGFQGVASFTGPLIAARWFFTGKNATTLDTVQWFVVLTEGCRFVLILLCRVYLAVAGLGVALNILF